MNYDEYIKEVDLLSGDDVVFRLSQHLSAWKDNDSDVIALADSVERFFGNSWIENRETHNHLYSLWSDFKKKAIESIGGMTMNERLYWFGLFDRFDSLQMVAAEKTIYDKLCAKANT